MRTFALISSATLFIALTIGMSKRHSLVPATPSEATRPQLSQSCADSISQGIVCNSANEYAVELMKQRKLSAFIVMQNVQTGALIAFAASQPKELDVTTRVLPLSVMKVLIAASWWDHRLPDKTFPVSRATTKGDVTEQVSIHEMLVNGSDSAGRQLATALRAAIGTKEVLNDLTRYGFLSSETNLDNTFWSAVSPSLQSQLIPESASISLSEKTPEQEWADTLSIGETNARVTGLHISRFMQMIGNGGIMMGPTARESTDNSRQATNKGTRVIREEAARRVQAGLRDAVQRGTAQSIATALSGIGWQMGGKTGTGPGPLPIGPQSDGWFAGLVFDAKGTARFTVATYVRHGGRGGGNAAQLSAEVAKFVIGK